MMERPEFHEALARQLRDSGAELVDVVPIPLQGDRMVRLRTLEEVLADFDCAGEGVLGYFIQVRQARPSRAAAPVLDPSPAAKATFENIYLGTGKLNIPFLMRNAEILAASGEWTLAKNVYKTILSSGEHSAIALAGVGRCLQAEGKLDEARAKYEESIAYQPTFDCFRWLGALLLTMGKEAQAAEIYERAFNHSLSSEGGKNAATGQHSIRFELCEAAGNCYVRARRLGDAERLYHRALELDPSADGIRANLGALYLGAGKLPEALRHFQDALASNPRNTQALSGLGSCALAEDNRKAAHDYFARSLEENLDQPQAIFHLVKIAYELKSYARAAKILADYVQSAPINANLLYSLAGLQFHLGKLADAGATVAKILELVPTHSGAQELQALIARYSRNPALG
jgi:tetratricopeptide (TPR) repeat protein